MSSPFLILLATIYSVSVLKDVASGADTYWHVIATSPCYMNFRMTTEKNFHQRRTPKAMPKMWARMDCATSCTANKDCRAFSFYEKNDYYACDIAGDNYCTNETGKALLHNNGSFVWDKINPEMTMGCLKPGPISCENIRPGCMGTYPNCTQCLKSCADCKSRYTYGRYRNCTMWPDGDGPESQPVTVLCDCSSLTLVQRRVKESTGEILTDIQLSFEDMSRIQKLKKYPAVRFVCKEQSGISHSSRYSVTSIESNGTLTNLAHYSENNVLNLSNSTFSTLQFVTVMKDTYGCGSFWLLDKNNATSCPGGGVKMFGTPTFNGTKLVSTGLRCGEINSGATFVEVALLLSSYA